MVVVRKKERIDRCHPFRACRSLPAELELRFDAVDRSEPSFSFLVFPTTTAALQLLGVSPPEAPWLCIEMHWSLRVTETRPSITAGIVTQLDVAMMETDWWGRRVHERSRELHVNAVRIYGSWATFKDPQRPQPPIQPPG